MQTKNLIQTSANVIRITNLKIGDLYKRYSDSAYDNSIYYGIVKAINNNGENTFLEAVEYNKSYSSITADFKVFSGDKDLSIFPATLDEIKDEFSKIVDKLEDEIKNKQLEIENKKKCIAETQLLITGELTDKLQSADFKTLTQSEYNQLKLSKASQLDF